MSMKKHPELYKLKHLSLSLLLHSSAQAKKKTTLWVKLH